MQCLACGTSSLRGFLKALINVELQVARPGLPTKQLTVSRCLIHNSSNARTVASSSSNKHRGILQRANSTQSNKTFLPFNDEVLKPSQSQQNMTDTQSRRISHPGVLRTSARAIHDSRHTRKEYSFGSRSEGSAHAEPQIVTWEGRASASQVEGWQSSTIELTGSDSKIDMVTLDGAGATSVLKSANGFAQEEPLAVNHGAKRSSSPLLNVSKVQSKTRDTKGDLGPKTPPGNKNMELASNTRRLRNPEDFQLRTRSEHRQHEPWQTQKKALKAKFGSSGWSPRKRLSPDALEGIRALHAQYPDKYTTPVLADQFQISPEAVRRILKSKWRANEEEEEERRQRWDKRGAAIWSKMVEIGIKPPKKWTDMGIGRGRNHARGGRRDGSMAITWESGNGSAPSQKIGSGATLSDKIL